MYKKGAGEVLLPDGGQYQLAIRSIKGHTNDWPD